MITAYLFVIFMGCFLFPIQITRDSTSLFAMLTTYFYVGLIFYGLFHKKPFRVFLTSFVLNTLGLLGRILLEWGEYSLTRSLTPLNITIYLLTIPILITLVYIMIPIIRKAKSNS